MPQLFSLQFLHEILLIAFCICRFKCLPGYKLELQIVSNKKVKLTTYFLYFKGSYPV